MKISSVVKVLFICNKVLYAYHTAMELISWINGKEGPFVFAKIDVKTFLSCATMCLLVTIDLFDWQGTTVVTVLFVAGYLVRVENIFIDGLPNSGIALLFFFFITILQVIQRLLEEKLTALQCAVFDKTLADLKTRIEKVECNKRHKTVLTELQVSVCVLNCILESNLKVSSSTFGSKSPVVVRREAILASQREAGGSSKY